MLSHKQILRQELECKFILNVMGKRKGREKGRLPGKKAEARDCGGDLELNPSGNSGKNILPWGEDAGVLTEQPQHSLVENCSRFHFPRQRNAGHGKDDGEG